MGCECMGRINGLLAEYNTKLESTFVFSGPKTGMFPTLGVKLVEKKRGQKPMAIMPTFCPFCGVKYEQTNPPAAGEVEL